MSKKIFVCLVMMLTLQLMATGTSNHQPSQLSKNARLKLADRYFGESLFYSAAENYQAYLTKKPTSRYANYWYAVSLYYAKDYTRAEKAFARFYSLTPTKKDNKKQWEADDKSEFKMGNYFYGLTLHRNGEFEKAKSVLSDFRSSYDSKDETERATVLRVVKQVQLSCDSAAFFPKAKVKIKALPKGVNHAYSETAPFSIKEGELYYTSTGADTVMTFKNYKNEKYTAIYKATTNGTEWNRGQTIGLPINEENYYTANATFNASGTRMYFTKCLERDDERPLCNIFESEVRNGTYGEPKRLPKSINFEELYTATHPAVRATENPKVEYLYFVSDRPGGKGGLDIWYTRRDKYGEYSQPELLSGAVNTAADEVSPFYNDSAKVLYFSSDGHPGFGGFDVFMAKQSEDNGKKWQTPLNLGKPINSGADDLFFSKRMDQTAGYFTSNREGTIPLAGIATASDDIFAWEDFKYAVEGNVKVTGEESLTLDGAKFMLYRKLEDGTRELLAIDSTGKGGNYFFKLNPDADYEVSVERPGFLPSVESITTKGLADEDTLNQNLKVNKENYIVYGEIAEDGKPERKIDGANLLVYEIMPGGQERLFKEQKLKIGESRYAMSVPTGKEYKIMARKEGYFAGNTRVSTKNLGNEVDSIRADISMKKMQLNVEYKLDNILYEFAKSTLTDQSKLILDSLYFIMDENPSIIIELSSHTDSVGSVQGNLKLSQARAQSCVTYLISKGIDKARMIPMGYGKSKPIAPNSTPEGADNPEGRALNRRTEFKILKM